MKTAEEIITPFIKKVKSGFGDFEMVDKHNAIKCIELFYKQFVGDLIESEHPDEIYPRAENWLQERRNWIAEVKILREKLEQEVNQFKQLPIGEEVKPTYEQLQMIITGLEEGCEQWKSRCTDLEWLLERAYAVGFLNRTTCLKDVDGLKERWELAKAFLYNLISEKQTQPVPSKEVQENQTYGEFMRSNPEISTPSTTDIEKEAEQLYPYWTNELVEETLYNSHQEVKREAHIKSYQMHRNDGLDQLIEWMEWESHRRWNESHELPDFTEILTKANEIKSSLK